MNTSPISAPEVSAALRDGFEVHAAALAHGCDTTLLPRQVLMVGTGESAVGEAAFAHGVPQSSTLSGVTFAQDKRMRRAILAKAGFSVPKGATFSVGRSRKAARAYADRIGYPVVLKPALGDNTIETQAGIADDDQFREAVTYYFTPPSGREDYVRAAYALTELREPGFHKGKLVVPPGYRFLVEKQAHGQYVRLLVLDGEVVSALHLPGGAWGFEAGAKDITEVVDQSLRQVGIDVVAAFHGLSLAAVDLVVPDYTASTRRRDATVVELSERPWLEAQRAVSPQLAEGVAERILRSGMAEESLDDPQQDLVAETRFEGAVAPLELLEVMLETSRQRGIEIYGRVSDRAMGEIIVTWQGPSAEIAWIVEKTLESGLAGQRAMLSETQVRARQEG